MLRLTSAKSLCHHLIRLLLFPHNHFKLPSQHTLDGGRLDFLPDSFFILKLSKLDPL
jgi:hypothetical protein